MTSNQSKIRKIITQYLNNNCDILCLENDLKEISSIIVEFNNNYMIFDEEFSIEIKFDEIKLNSLLDQFKKTKESLVGSLVKIKGYEIDLYHTIENDENITYHVRMLAKDFEITFLPNQKARVLEFPGKVSDDNEIYLKIYELKYKETQVFLK